ncbi:Uncharacterized protein BP5553_00213 [Venustampulla echinocandica]|uniref:Ubiquitin 3 binding protein But2 C-terminal domain-containing protein n=1 Tax=Venustampulla echinocandica TaxID=2656787 RepID=A0A370TXG9_9HELO|nr:Uncharacterized protein BP5553_00213 [Venustampulla echinocandica]RDL40234.1 Uncharacterized protein BP5553_00213 [Venustampulla echinocandica]
MQFATILSLAACLSLGTASPVDRRTGSGVIVFHGAAGAQYTLTVPLDGSNTPTNNVLSISSVSSSTVNVGSQCTLHTVDSPVALVEGPAGTWVVGPPQTVTSISCSSGSTPPVNPPATIVIEFDGADPDQGAKYSLNVPLNGATIPTNNALSISTLVSTFADLPTKCHFVYVDFPAALSLIRPNTWAVGPPQTITSVSCHA